MTTDSDLPSQALWDENRKALASMRNEISALRGEIERVTTAPSPSPAATWDVDTTAEEIARSLSEVKGGRLHGPAYSAAKAGALEAFKRVAVRAGGWIVGNGTGLRWRTWKDGLPDWTADMSEATRYARREDAEVAHREDDDACIVVEYGPLPDCAATNASDADGWRSEAEAAIAAALQYLRGQDSDSVSGAIRNGDLRSRLKWVLMGCGGPLRSSSSPQPQEPT